MRAVTAEDGRVLALEEYGDPSGRPVLFVQGTPSSRLWRHPDESLAADVGDAGPIDAPGARARMTPLRKLGLLGATRAPALLRAGMWLIGPSRDPERFFVRFTAGVPARDRALLARPAVRENPRPELCRGGAPGNRGFAHEVGLFAPPLKNWTQVDRSNRRMTRCSIHASDTPGRFDFHRAARERSHACPPSSIT